MGIHEAGRAAELVPIQAKQGGWPGKSSPCRKLRDLPQPITRLPLQTRRSGTGYHQRRTVTRHHRAGTADRPRSVPTFRDAYIFFALKIAPYRQCEGNDPGSLDRGGEPTGCGATIELSKRRLAQLASRHHWRVSEKSASRRPAAEMSGILDARERRTVAAGGTV